MKKVKIGPCRDCGKNKSKFTKFDKKDPMLKPVLECLSCGYKLVRKTENAVLEAWNRPVRKAAK